MRVGDKDESGSLGGRSDEGGGSGSRTAVAVGAAGGAVNEVVLNISETTPPHSLLAKTFAFSKAVAKQFRTCYEDVEDKIAAQASA